MRIASLVPSATEILFELGLGERVVAVTHECDWPLRARSIPRLTRSVIPNGLSAAEIDASVRKTVAEGRPLYELDRERLAEQRPELIITQNVCEVCAVSYDDVVAVAATLPSKPRVISLDPMTLEDVLDDVRRIAAATEVEDRAKRLLDQMERRLDATRTAVADGSRPRVLALEWLDPPFVAGHWVPEMIALAGGSDVLGRRGQKSRGVEWGELQTTELDAVVIMPCGYDATRSAAEARLHSDNVAVLPAKRVVAVDASAYFSRPGPRLITGVELLASIIHPERVPPPTEGEAIAVELTRALSRRRARTARARAARAPGART